MFLSRRPSPAEIDTFLAVSRDLPLSYGPVGLSGHATPAFRIDQQRAFLGRADATFTRARSALASWTHFDLGWVELLPRGAPVQPGTVVAVLVRHLGFWSLNGCRVVSAIDNDSEFSFAYGTLTNHAESGEELFKVSRCAETGDVSYLIRAASRPRAALAKLGYPITRSLQARFRRESCGAMARAVQD